MLSTKLSSTLEEAEEEEDVDLDEMLDLDEEKEDIEVAEEFMQGEIYERYPEEIKERIQKNLKIAKKNILFALEAIAHSLWSRGDYFFAVLIVKFFWVTLY